MRNLKRTALSTTAALPSVERLRNSEIMQDDHRDCLLPSYPAVWKNAFALGQNVRFTRTPEVEILRRRVEEDPHFAAKYRALIQKKHSNPEESALSEISLSLNEMQSVEVDNLSPVDDVDTLCNSVQADVSETEGASVLTRAPLFHLSDALLFEAGLFDLCLPTLSMKVPRHQVALCDHFRVVECRGWSDGSLPVAPLLAVGAESCSLATPSNPTDIIPNAPTASADVQTITDLAYGAAMIENPVEADDCVPVSVIPKSEHGVEKVVGAPSSIVLGRSLTTSISTMERGIARGAYEFPSIELLQKPSYQDGAVISRESLERSAGLLESVLEDFGIKGEIIHVRPGPVVTMYEFEPAAGVKSSRVIGLADDIARSMSAISARVAVIPGRNVIGIELPNPVRETVYLRELIQSKPFGENTYKLALALGKSIGGEPIIAELAKMPHLLVAGTTGSGKSVAINTMILSLLYRLTPDQCRLIMVDPKMLELSIYDGIPHLLTPVVTDPKKAVTALKWAVREMEDRYRKMAKLGVRNIDGFNSRVEAAAAKGETIMCTVQVGFDKETGDMLYQEEAMDLSKLPYIVVIVDEMADLMMVAGKEIEGAIQRLAQMARAAGIHLIMATQRPSVDVITGTIKANFPTRISFQVTSKIDSRTILGEQGAETLLGQGDMLHMIGGGRIMRVHGPFVSDEEVEQVVAHLKAQGTPDYLATVTDGEAEEDTLDEADSIAEIVAASHNGEDSEDLYLQAVKVVMRDKKCSTSYIQRRLGIGYNKAASLVERMEKEGIVGPANHVGKRDILLSARNEQDT